MQAFAERILQRARDAQLNVQTSRFLEVGSGVGGLTFALAKHCGAGASVIGVDHSAHATETARRLLQGETVQASLAGEGNMSTTLPIALSTQSAMAQVQFRMADPMSLPAEMMGFDVVVLHDVIDTLASPNALLGRLGGVRGLVRPGGLLVVSSAYRWSEDRTPRDLWLGGYTALVSGTGAEQQAAAVSSVDALQARLALDFAHVCSEPVQQVWAESASQLRGSVQTVSYFRRK
jgi:SAM-dependent methyltransferase